MKKLIFVLFAILLFFVPLVLWPFTSEVFEFNKIVLLYILTTLISTAWLVRCVIEKRFIFSRTLLDIPLLIFLGSQIISTLLSIDFYTSVYGYYSRFNGGLLSIICYLTLYWAFVSNLDRKYTLFIIRTSLFSATLVAAYGVLEHFGIDKDIWVQDVQSRVFSTLGQPNWLAAYVVALLPIIFISKFKVFNQFLIFNLLFITLLFTKSRSGLVGFVVANIIYWSLVLYKDFKFNIKQFSIYHLSFIILALVIGTQFTPSIFKSQEKTVAVTSGTALENGGTESGTIRKIVWQGALDIWKNYPVFGTGLETYAYSYYLYRPVAHNTTSEWDFIYNKAHNEFLNFAANSGTVGLISYLIVIGFSIYIFISTKNYALLAGYVSLSVSNFFGFSVVPTQLQFFLFPAIAIALKNE